MNPTEDQIQRACAQWLDVQMGFGRLRYTAIPLGEYRAKATAARLKGLGCRAGAPDLVIALGNGTVLWAEVKAEGGRLSPEQKGWRDWLTGHGHPHAVIRSLDDLIDFVAEHGGLIDPVGRQIPMLGTVS